ncbi:MAG: hypothetical protein KAU06_03300 [Candidatus Marinimicrobia bacterium]|nr:hypothetical protein [Candidatus Neomarinimicrobiota bacterium]
MEVSAPYGYEEKSFKCRLMGFCQPWLRCPIEELQRRYGDEGIPIIELRYVRGTDGVLYYTSPTQEEIAEIQISGYISKIPKLPEESDAKI